MTTLMELLCSLCKKPVINKKYQMCDRHAQALTRIKPTSKWRDDTLRRWEKESPGFLVVWSAFHKISPPLKLEPLKTWAPVETDERPYQTFKCRHCGINYSARETGVLGLCPSDVWQLEYLEPGTSNLSNQLEQREFERPGFSKLWMDFHSMAWTDELPSSQKKEPRLPSELTWDYFRSIPNIDSLGKENKIELFYQLKNFSIEDFESELRQIKSLAKG